METRFMKMKNSRTNKPHKFVLNKLRLIAPMWNDEFVFPNGSYSESDIQVCVEYIIKKHKTLTSISPIHVYINRINNRLVFKIKDGYKLELQTSETMKLFASTKKINRKNKKRRKFRVLK